jgi:hypothetical protein
MGACDDELAAYNQEMRSLDNAFSDLMNSINDYDTSMEYMELLSILKETTKDPEIAQRASNASAVAASAARLAAQENQRANSDILHFFENADRAQTAYCECLEEEKGSHGSIKFAPPSGAKTALAGDDDGDDGDDDDDDDDELDALLEEVEAEIEEILELLEQELEGDDEEDELGIASDVALIG